MRKTKAEAEKTREQLLEAALDMFLEYGVSKTSMQAIAQHAGVTRGALYWHFKNKADLFDVLLQQGFEDIRSSFSDSLAGKQETLRASIIHLFKHLQHDERQRKLCIILNLKCEHTEENRAIVELHCQYIGLWEEHFRQLLQSAVEQGELPAALSLPRAVQYLHTIIGGLISIWLFHPDTDLDETAPPLIDAAVFTLQHSPDLRQIGH